jgi:hypothetical protein
MKRFKLNSQARRRMALFLVLSLVLSLPLSGAALGAPPRDADEVEGGVQRIWALERVDAPQAYSNLTQRSLRVDSNNYPRVAYGGDHLYYARYDGSTWNITTVDGSFGVGQYASLALDRNGNPHIAYYDALNGALKYASFTNNQWSVQTVDGSQAFALQADTLAPEEQAPAGPD